MIGNINEENMNFWCNRTINNVSIQISNSKIWTFFLDNKLRDFVIEYNFNFADIANRFQEFIAYPYKYDFTEEEIRKHWAFLHSSRYLKKDIDDKESIISGTTGGGGIATKKALMKLSIDKLKSKCEDRKLSTEGTKNQLADRIIVYDNTIEISDIIDE